MCLCVSVSVRMTLMLLCPKVNNLIENLSQLFLRFDKTKVSWKLRLQVTGEYGNINNIHDANSGRLHNPFTLTAQLI